MMMLSSGYANDNCASAISITPTFTDCNFQAATSANASQSIPGCSGNADDDVWFSFVANSTSMTITVDPTSGYDAVIELFSGVCGSLTSIQCQDINGQNGDEVLTNTSMIVGNTYYVRVYHYGAGSGTGTFNICVTGLAPPNNNTPCNAYALPTVTPNCNFQTYTNLGSAGSSVATPTGCGGSAPYQGGYQGGDVWFSVVVPASGTLDIHTLSIDFTDGAMALYSGPCSSPTLVQCDDDSGPGTMPYIYATGLTPGTTMYIRVWEYNNNNNGQFGICVSTPDNDNCANAQQICDLNGYGGVTSSAYTIDQPCNMCGIGNPSSPNPGCVFGTGYTGTSPVQIDNNSWLSFTADSTAAELFVQVNVCANGNGMQMQIFEGVGCCNFIPVSNFLETTTSQSIIATGLTPGNTYYIVVDGFAGDVCSYTISATSGVDVVRVVPNDAAICLGDTVTLNAQVNGGGSYTYSWTSQPNDPSLTTPSAPSITVTPTTSTLYSVSITGKCGTPSVATAYVTVNPNPTVIASALDTVLCMGESTTLLGAASGGLFDYNYYWSGAPLLDIIPPFPLPAAIFTPSAPGNYNIVVQAIDTIGCNGKDSVNIVVNPTPTATISANPTTICLNDTVVLDATDPSVTSYQWNTGATTPVINETPTSNTTYTVIVSNTFNCTDTASQAITVNPLPNVQLTGDSMLCLGETANLSATGANTYQWNTGATSTAISTTPSADSLITVTGTDANGCSNSDSLLVQVTAQPTATITGDSVICIGDTVNLTASGGNTYTWISPANINGNTSTSITDIPTTNPAVYAVIAAIGNCSDTAYRNVTVNALPVVGITGNSPVCLGDTAQITASGGVAYVWNTGATTATITDVPATTTTYSVTVTNANNCSDTGSYTLIVNPLPNIQISGNDSLCDGSSGTLTASGGVSYLWSTNESNPQIIISPTATTTYYVVGYDNNGCGNIDSMTVVLLPKPTAQITGDTLVCYNSQYTLVASGGTTYLWSDGTTNDTLSGIAIDTSSYYVIVGLGMCADTAYTSLYAKPLPAIDAYQDTTIFLGQSVGITAVSDYPVIWLNSDSLSCDNCLNPVANPAHTTTYCVQTQLNGCVDTACVTVYVDETCGEVFVPTAFSPNDDGNNDCLKAYGNCIKDIVFRVYSRWGEVIFESTNKYECWDGTFKGKALNTGVYVFTVNAKLYNGEEVFMKGNVSLFR